MKKTFLNGLGAIALLLRVLLLLLCFLSVLIIILGFLNLFGLWDSAIGDTDDCILVIISFGVITIVSRLLSAMFGRISDWAHKKAKEHEAFLERKRAEELRAWAKKRDKEHQAWLAAMTPEQRRIHDIAQEQQRELARIRKELRDSGFDGVLHPGLGAGSGFDGALHDELDAVARASGITRTYGTDWIGYDAEAPGPNPDTYSPPGYDPEAYTGDIW